MAAHAPPPLSQRSQRNVKLIGESPLHEPVDAVSDWPTVGEPEIAGGLLLAGGAPASWASVAAEPMPTEVARARPATATRPSGRKRLLIFMGDLSLNEDTPPFYVLGNIGVRTIYPGLTGDHRRFTATPENRSGRRGDEGVPGAT